MKMTYAEFYGVYYDNQTDTWERIREIPMIKKRLDEEKIIPIPSSDVAIA